MGLKGALHPPHRTGALARREARFAGAMLAPTALVVALVVVLPLLAVFWISLKPVGLADLRPTTALVRETPRFSSAQPVIEYRIRNSRPDRVVRDVTLKDALPPGVTVTTVPDGCITDGRIFTCRFGDIKGGFRDRLRIPVTLEGAPAAELAKAARSSPPEVGGAGDNTLFSLDFTWVNFASIFDRKEFLTVLGVTFFYATFGTIGALVVGLFAALLLNESFRGQGILRGLCLFPYVAPVIAVAFTWVTLFDPFSGSANALLLRMGVTEEAINFFGQRPLALIMVTVFEIWRYFPLSFLFILARMQSIDGSIYEAADMDGASPLQKFRYLALPQLMGILSVLFLLRFIWTFNKFDDIFLLTGGNAGTRTLTVNVYEQAFAIANIGSGAAVAVVIFVCLLLFSMLFFRFLSREEGL